VLPLAATLTSEAVYEAFLGDYAEFKTFFHGHTYTGNPLACAAALASLELFKQDDLLGRLPARIEQLSQGLNRIADMEHVAEVRQQGLMVGVELVQEKETGDPYPPEMRMGHEVIMACRKRGVIIRPLGDTVVLMPPLSSTPEEIDLLLDALAQGIAEVTEGKRCLAASL
jgi:adenosylmethionine-8-amino-7-oxononanoate aminotransferase